MSGMRKQEVHRIMAFLRNNGYGHPTWARVGPLVNAIMAKSLALSGNIGVHAIEALYRNRAFYLETYWVHGILRIKAIRTAVDQKAFVYAEKTAPTKKEAYDWKKENAKAALQKYREKKKGKR